MDLDPFFEERLRVHRKYLFDQALGSVRSRLSALWPFAKGPAPATGMGGGGAAPATAGTPHPSPEHPAGLPVMECRCKACWSRSRTCDLLGMNQTRCPPSLSCVVSLERLPSRFIRPEEDSNPLPSRCFLGHEIWRPPEVVHPSQEKA